MTQMVTAPLPALISYYERLEADPDIPIAGYGFSREKIHFEVVLERNGTLANNPLNDIREGGKSGKPIHQTMLVPDGGGRSGAGVKAFFCWDNTGYTLGRDNKGKPERAAKMFEAFRELHLEMKDTVGDDEGYTALCRFLEQWDPVQAESLPGWEDAAGLNVVFKLRGAKSYIHQSPAVQQAWCSRIESASSDDTVEGKSLISGQTENLARLHPMISGVVGANSTGAAIVSFNLDSFKSYGKDQSYNAPMGAQDAFKYTTALNHLLDNNERRVRIGDATVVFWTGCSEAKDAEDFFAATFGEDASVPDEAEKAQLIDRLRGFLQAARQGRLTDLIQDPGAPFYILGLSPNKSRINIRFWQVGTVSQFAERLAMHVDNLEMVGEREGSPPLMVRSLLFETAREPKEISPQLAGELTRSVLSGSRYPQALFSAVIRRVHADLAVNHRRAAILKAFLIRNHRKEVPVALNPDHPDQAYHLGRLFSALEKTQEDASGGNLNSTIKDRYFTSASTTPAIVFPRLLQLHQHHMDKIEHVGQQINREKIISEIMGHIGQFPSHQPLEKQGMFCIGYYHQRQDFFTSKKGETNNE